MKRLLFGISIIVIIGVGGLVYRNAIERPLETGACTLDARVCPDGTTLGRTGPSCTFPACPPPNVVLEGVGITYAVPSGFLEAELRDAATLAAYETAPATMSASAAIEIRRYMIQASSTALDTIKETAIGGASGLPVSATAFSSVTLGGRRFTVVSIERFEGVIDVAYYLARSKDVLRFDAIDRGVVNWTETSLDVSSLPAQSALRGMLGTLQSQ